MTTSPLKCARRILESRYACAYTQPYSHSTYGAYIYLFLHTYAYSIFTLKIVNVCILINYNLWLFKLKYLFSLSTYLKVFCSLVLFASYPPLLHLVGHTLQ